MSNFTVRKMEKTAPKLKSFLPKQTTKKDLSLVLKLSIFLILFLVLIYLSINNNDLMLSEILKVGGILFLVFLFHISLNR
ncbi:hypothetical protein BTO04_00335 [Polaribacter sp. SA4-10]|nr:hypothetical protein BTO04_00335 [Polaribacter sp. SA4-10]